MGTPAAAWLHGADGVSEALLVVRVDLLVALGCAGVGVGNVGLAVPPDWLVEAVGWVVTMASSVA